MAQSSFQAQVDAWVRQTKERVVAVRNEAAQRVIETMQEPGPSRATAIKAVAAGAGLGKVKSNGSRGVSKRAFGPIPNPGGSGNLPVDTGFLRASLVVGRGPLTVPTTTPPEDGGSFQWDDDQVSLTIQGADLDDVISCRYAAVYARVAEYGGPGRAPRRFVALAAQRWPNIVAEVVREAKATP